MRKLANSAARDIASPAVKMGNKGLFPGVAVPLAFFCTLFFRHRKKSVSAPWDGQSLSAPESARHSPPGQGVCACGRTKGLSSGQTIGAARTAVRSACCLPELRVANRLRRLYPLDDGELFKFNLKSSVCQRQTGLPKGNPPCVFPSFPFGNLRIATRSNRAPHRAASPSPAPESARQSPPRGIAYGKVVSY